MNPEQTARFWLRVRPTQSALPHMNSSCWLWTGQVVNSGYGRAPAGKKGKRMTAHRLAWTLIYGPIPPGMFVLHECDQKLCCNPRHLFLGTAADNSADMVSKGRGRNRPKTFSTTKEQRDEIRARSKSLTRRQLANEFNLSVVTIGRILNFTFQYAKDR